MAGDALGLPRAVLTGLLGGVIAFNLVFVLLAKQKGLFDPPVVIKRQICPDVRGLEQTLELEKSALETRRQEVDASQRQLEELKRQVELGSRPIEESKQRIEELASQMRAGREQAGAEVEKRIDLAVKTFSSMKADAAVAVLEKMDMRETAQVIARMKPKLSAAILGKMDPRKASAVMEIVKNQ